MKHRAYLGTLALLAAGGVLGLVARGRTWGSAEVPSSFTVDTTSVSGGDLAPFVSAVPFVALAAVILVPAVRRVGRRITGVILMLLAAATMVNAAVVGADLDGQVEDWITSSPDYGGTLQAMSTSMVWVFVAAAGALAVLVAGLLVAVRGPAWPSMGARYERPAKTGATGAAAAASGTSESGTPESDTSESGTAADTRSAPVANSAQTWDALDRGDDPTA